MKILFLTYYFEPDLCAGSFRNSSLFKELIKNLKGNDKIDVVTTHPNRYDSYKVNAESLEKRGANITINRIKIPNHKNGLFGQIKSFKKFYTSSLNLVNKDEYDLVYASSSRLFTAFLGSKIARKSKAKLYLDIRDIFRETITDVFKHPLIKLSLNLILKPIENYTFKKANHINLVSKGFKSYFNKYNNCTYSFYTNGIDDIFLNIEQQPSKKPSNKKTILYAGNIGESQGLHLILPQLAKAFEETYKFIIIGDGGAKEKLIIEINNRNLRNVELLNPINRNILIEKYQEANFLLLHLNKQKAFERVLPSKLFEYGAFDKPIIAGVSGYAAKFLEKEMKNLISFNPGDYEECVKKLKLYDYKEENRTFFIEKYSRKNINVKMVKSILSKK